MGDKGTDIVAAGQDGADDAMDEGSYKVKLKKPVMFEGKSYSVIDMSGMEDVTAADMVAVSRKLAGTGNVDFLQENSLEYAIEIAARATGLPLEFFYQLKPAVALKVKRCVTSFLYAQE